MIINTVIFLIILLSSINTIMCLDCPCRKLTKELTEVCLLFKLLMPSGGCLLRQKKWISPKELHCRNHELKPLWLSGLWRVRAERKRKRENKKESWKYEEEEFRSLNRRKYLEQAEVKFWAGIHLFSNLEIYFLTHS